MQEDERRTIEELITRYEFEPGLKDIYVEGIEDKDILEGMIEEYKITGVSVYEISSIYVPAELGEENNNRTRLIKLSMKFVGAFCGKSLCLACIIDSDFNYISGHSENNIFLYVTDYANIEMYFFSTRIFEKLNKQCLGGRMGITTQMINNSMLPILQSLFIIRYINSSSAWRMECLSFEKLISFKNGRLNFNREEYIKRYLNKNRRLTEIADFQNKIEQVSIPDGFDPRCFIHGHDFLNLLRYMLNNICGRKIYEKNEVVFNLLRACADYKDLGQEQMFTTLLRKFS